MVRITSIEIKNFRAFPRTYQINLTKTGKNLLVYGENGSGKTSLYLALKSFLESSGGDSTEFKKYQNIFVPDDGYIKLHLRANKNSKEDTYEWSRTVTEETKTQLILDASKAKGFLDYKSLLHTHYIHYNNDTVNVFDLLVNTLLANITNDLTDPPRSFAENWRDILDVLYAVQIQGLTVLEEELEEQLDIFNRGIAVKLADLQTDVSKILGKFRDKDPVITLKLDFPGVVYNRDQKTLDNQEIFLKVEFFDEEVPSHHLFLNEAKLSAIAIAIYLASILLQPESDLRVLALDDVLIGLDMSNRLPVLDILKEYFSGYQIFLTTYDRAWYEIVKQRTEEKDWKYTEFYFGQTDEYEIPIYVEDKAYLDRAREYLDVNDYKACAVYIRTAFEATIKRYCEKKGLAIKYLENPKDLKSEDFWVPIKMEMDESGLMLLDLRIVDEVEQTRKFILNELSHATFVNIYKKELEDAIGVVKRLETALA